MAYDPTPACEAQIQSSASIKTRLTDRFDFCAWTVVHAVHVCAAHDEPSEPARCR